MRHILKIIIALLLVSCNSKKDEKAKEQDMYYTCSMDPQVIEHKPGKCPICKMDLTPVKKSEGEKSDEIKLSEQQIQLGNIKYDTLFKGTIDDKLVLTATLNFDQVNTTSVSSRVMGRIERLYFKNLGDYVKKGSPLFDLYSEELSNAQQEYILAIERKKILDNTVIDFNQLIQSAKHKLQLWGMNEAQINELVKSKKAPPVTTFYSKASGIITEFAVKEGDYINEGGTVFKLADISTLWAEAQVYTYQLSEIARASEAIVQIPDLNNKEIRGRIEFINPEINPDTRINLIRVSIPNTENQLKPGMPAYVLLKSQLRKSLTLPIDAVIRDGKGATVWVKTGNNTFKSKMVETGLETGDRIEIKSGLKAGDVIVITGAYLLHSEYIFKKGINPMEGHDMNKM
ncbi:efflux RND transporter periplasmic adaptor subunit [Solitalea lacus]|uniref:efflux RND transporter periplasmic adaptor subunit n=1 Tax=Solitalea lacus TaxID=2911172 RepID=UPI001EDBCB88|nr:efflux RND transporter periplasmic adaptor subunit [Solitalea lacus]UKJ06595.1 efflux RND transporter periplasmic adaptor subunit [Solitalea lacus]